MSKKYFLVLIMLLCGLATFNRGDAAEIKWFTNYDSAAAEAKSANKPIVLAFTGSDWCGWCQKLDREVLHTSEFARLAGDKFVWVSVDFPKNTKIPQTLEAQNKALQTRFGIRGFPTLVILDKNEQKIATMGYRAGGAATYADYLLETAFNGQAR